MSAVLVLCNKVRVGRGGDEWLMDDGTNGLANFFEMLQKLHSNTTRFLSRISYG
jgi:hypothetical protein